MLIPHHQVQQVCQQCGLLPVSVTAVCPSCRARLALPWSPQSLGSQTIAPFAPGILPPHPSSFLPLLVELPLNVLGIYGIGWLLLGNITGGLMLLVGSLLLWPVMVLLSIFTMGLGFICLGPLALGVMIGNLLLLQRAIRRNTFQKDRREGKCLGEAHVLRRF